MVLGAHGAVITIVGGGRMGLGLARALGEAGEHITLWSRREATGAVRDAVSGARTVLLAVPDDAITEVASGLATVGAIDASQVVLHLSGLRDARALHPLETCGAALGSFHPLQTITDPATAPQRFHGAIAAIEGDSRATAEAERLARLLGLEPVRVAPAAKPSYHAGAVIAGNYVVVLAAIAARLAEKAGISQALAERMYLPLLLAAADNLTRESPDQALTGPVRRGDVATLKAHLETLTADDRRLYAQLGLEALALARKAGLDAARADEVERVLRDY